MTEFTISSREMTIRVELQLSSNSDQVRLKWLTQRTSEQDQVWYCLSNQVINVGAVEFTALVKQFEIFVLASISYFKPLPASQVYDHDPFYDPGNALFFASQYNGMIILAQANSSSEVEVSMQKLGRMEYFQPTYEIFQRSDCERFGLSVIRELNDFYRSKFPEYSHWVIPEQIDYLLQASLLREINNSQAP